MTTKKKKTEPKEKRYKVSVHLSVSSYVFVYAKSVEEAEKKCNGDLGSTWVDLEDAINNAHSIDVDSDDIEEADDD